MGSTSLFKATNKTTQALRRIAEPVREELAYRALVDDLYFLFHEGPADRLQGHRATAFSDIGSLRTELRHDTDHGKPRRVRAKRKKAGHTFKKYSGASSPVGLPPERFAVVQLNLLSAVETDLRGIIEKL